MIFMYFSSIGGQIIYFYYLKNINNEYNNYINTLIRYK